MSPHQTRISPNSIGFDRMKNKKASTIISRIRPLAECDGETLWPDNQVDFLNVKLAWVRKLKVVIEEAADEKPIQKYLEQRPALLGQLLGGGHGRWVFPRRKLGTEYEADFVLCERDSGGFHWKLVELENPNHRPLNGKGSRSGKLAVPLRQIDEWRAWLREHVAYARNQYKFTDIDAEFQGIIVIGRRTMLEAKHRQRYRELSRDPLLTVMSYDRLVERIESAAQGHAELLRTVRSHR